jgi:hypothetical protein
MAPIPINATSKPVGRDSLRLAGWEAGFPALRAFLPRDGQRPVALVAGVCPSVGMFAKPLSQLFEHCCGAKALFHLALSGDVARVRFEQAAEPVGATDTAYERDAQRCIIVCGVFANLRLNALDGQFKHLVQPLHIHRATVAATLRRGLPGTSHEEGSAPHAGI